MVTIKLSYSIMNAWANGRWEDAVSMYLGRPIAQTPELKLGKLKHKVWENYIKNWGKLPYELGGEELINPLVEMKWEKLIPMGDNYQILLRGVIDVQHGKHGEILDDHKCGMTGASTLVGSMQFPYYKLLQPKAALGRYNIFNPYTEEFSRGIKILDDRDAKEALEHLITYGSEMIDYLQSQKQLINYKPEIYS